MLRPLPIAPFTAALSPKPPGSFAAIESAVLFAGGLAAGGAPTSLLEGPVWPPDAAVGRPVESGVGRASVKPPLSATGWVSSRPAAVGTVAGGAAPAVGAAGALAGVGVPGAGVLAAVFWWMPSAPRPWFTTDSLTPSCKENGGFGANNCVMRADWTVAIKKLFYETCADTLAEY